MFKQPLLCKRIICSFRNLKHNSLEYQRNGMRHRLECNHGDTRARYPNTINIKAVICINVGPDTVYAY